MEKARNWLLNIWYMGPSGLWKDTRLKLNQATVALIVLTVANLTVFVQKLKMMTAETM